MSKDNSIIVWAERVPARLSWDEWTSRVHNVGMLKKKIAWYIGDLLNYGLDTFGERAWQEIEANLSKCVQNPSTRAW